MMHIPRRKISDKCLINKEFEPLGSFKVWAQRAVDERGQTVAVPY